MAGFRYVPNKKGDIWSVIFCDGEGHESVHIRTCSESDAARITDHWNRDLADAANLQRFEEGDDTCRRSLGQIRETIENAVTPDAKSLATEIEVILNATQTPE